MANRPNVRMLNASSVDILNAIRNNASTNYKDYVPVATSDVEDIKTIGAVLMEFPALKNEFLSALVNRIGMVLITSKAYSNPWAMFKKGVLEFGDTVEEIFVEMAKGQQFDPAVAENELFKREMPDVRAAFHVMNKQTFYKTTVSNQMIKQAFTGADGVTNLINKIIEGLYKGAAYDEFMIMKYMLACNILDGRLVPVDIADTAVANMKSIVTTIKATSNNLEFLGSDYNVAGVYNATDKANQYLIVNTDFDAMMDVEVLASAFNMDKTTFAGHRILTDGFGKIDMARLRELFKDNTGLRNFSADELNALNAIPAIVVDENYFMIYDNLAEFDEQKNAQGLYWNYFYHTWQTYSVSPFSNAIVFTPADTSVVSVEITPANATITVGQSVALTANVTTTGFANKAVIYTSDDDCVKVDAYGKCTAVATGSATITATSVYDGSKTDTCTITVN